MSLVAEVPPAAKPQEKAEAPAAAASPSASAPSPAPSKPAAEPAPVNSTVAEPTECLFYPLVNRMEFPTSVELVEAWTKIYQYLDGPEYRAHRKKLGEIWGEEPMFILTSVEINAAQFRPVADRARKAGFPETLIEQISLCMALRSGNVEGMKDWLPRVQARIEAKPYLGDEALLPTVEGATLLARFGEIAVRMEGDRRTIIMQLTEKPRMLAEADSVFRDLDAIDSAVIRLQNKGVFKEGDTVPPAEWQGVLPKEARYQRLRRTGENILGHAYGNQIIGKRPMVPMDTFNYFETMFQQGDWFPYRDPKAETVGTVVLDSSKIPRDLDDASLKGKTNRVISETWESVPNEAPKSVSGTRVTPETPPAAEEKAPGAPRGSGVPPPAIRELPAE